VGGDATAVEVTIDETTGEIKDRQQSSASATATSGNAAGAAKQPASGATGN
ncbi:MAG: efflux RND transporter periplasmic adaptor subunit, partial [Mesorhizobium sp.]